MANVILTILAVLGRIILCLLLIFLFLLLTVFFYPITYRLQGECEEKQLRFTVRINWLYGLLGISYAYPESGDVMVRLFWKRRKLSAVSERKKKAGNPKEEEQRQSSEENQLQDAENRGAQEEESPAAEQNTVSKNKAESREKSAQKHKIFAKFAGIRQTILKRYDKIKEIWGNLSYYRELLQDKNTVCLWQHAKRRLGKVFRSLRPRRIRGRILFGTGSPDTTGYLFGIYSMLSPQYGSMLCVTPDFTQQLLEGQLELKGRVALCVLAWNSLGLLLDRRLRLFLKQIKSRRRKG